MKRLRELLNVALLVICLVVLYTVCRKFYQATRPVSGEVGR